MQSRDSFKSGANHLPAFLKKAGKRETVFGRSQCKYFFRWFFGCVVWRPI